MTTCIFLKGIKNFLNVTPKTTLTDDAPARIARQDKDSKSHVLRGWTGEDDGMATLVVDFEV